VIWEVLTKNLPFADVKFDWKLIELVRAGTRPDKSLIPPTAPTELVQLMEICWHQDPERRPKFLEIVEALDRRLPTAAIGHRSSGSLN
jgi:hypothetical protein